MVIERVREVDTIPMAEAARLVAFDFVAAVVVLVAVGLGVWERRIRALSLDFPFSCCSISQGNKSGAISREIRD